MSPDSQGAGVSCARRQINVLFWLLMSLCLVSLGGCLHSRLQIVSNPEDAQVFRVDVDGKRREAMGRTPLSVDDLDHSSVGGFDIEAPGYIPVRLHFPYQRPNDSKLFVNLQPLNPDWVKELPPDLFKKTLEKSVGDHVRFQGWMYSRSESDVRAQIQGMEKRYGNLSVFHFLIGNYYFYRQDYNGASTAFLRALELDPTNEDARRLLVLVDLKVVSRSEGQRSQAFAHLESSAREIAELNNGLFRKNISTEKQRNIDGFEIVLPSDPLFVEDRVRPSREAWRVAGRLTEELNRIYQPFDVIVEAHTDSNVLAETKTSSAESMRIKGNTRFRSLWELTAVQSAAFMEILKSEGVRARGINIAGYGDSRPMTKKGNSDPDLMRLNRRMVVRVTFPDVDRKTKDELFRKITEDPGVERQLSRPVLKPPPGFASPLDDPNDLQNRPLRVPKSPRIEVPLPVLPEEDNQ